MKGVFVIFHIRKCKQCKHALIEPYLNWPPNSCGHLTIIGLPRDNRLINKQKAPPSWCPFRKQVKY